MREPQDHAVPLQSLFLTEFHEVQNHHPATSRLGKNNHSITQFSCFHASPGNISCLVSFHIPLYGILVLPIDSTGQHKPTETSFQIGNANKSVLAYLIVTLPITVGGFCSLWGKDIGGALRWGYSCVAARLQRTFNRVWAWRSTFHDFFNLHTSARNGNVHTIGTHCEGAGYMLNKGLSLKHTKHTLHTWYLAQVRLGIDILHFLLKSLPIASKQYYQLL